MEELTRRFGQESRSLGHSRRRLFRSPTSVSAGKLSDDASGRSIATGKVCQCSSLSANYTIGMIFLSRTESGRVTPMIHGAFATPPRSTASVT